MLLVEVAVAAIWVTRQLLTIVSEDLDAEWSSLWVFDAFWHVLYFCVLGSIAWLWSPSMASLQYAFQDETDFAASDVEEAEE